MKNNYTVYTLGGLSFLFIAAAIYFHYGYFDFVNEHIYSNAAIPSAFKEDKFYFMNKKLALKNKTMYGLSFFSFLLFFFNRNIATKQLRFLLFIQCLVVLIALLFWILIPKGGLIY